MPIIGSSVTNVFPRFLHIQAGALMIVTLLAQKAALTHNVVKSLMHLVAELARADAKETTDFQWLRMSFMALINIVQVFQLNYYCKTRPELISSPFVDISVIIISHLE